MVLRALGDSPIERAWAYLSSTSSLQMLAELECGDIELLYFIAIMFQMQERFVIEGFLEEVCPAFEKEVRSMAGTDKRVKLLMTRLAWARSSR